MDINNQFDKEMLSAYLDDALTATELGQVERWLAEDPHAADYLERLRSNRNTLKALASLPTVGLRPTFAERVVAQAVTAKAASLQELAAEAETQLPQAGRVHLPASQPTTKSRPWWAWATIATTAAAISWFAFAPKWETAKPLTLIPSAGADANGGPSAGDVASNSPGVPTGQDPAIGNQLPVVRPDEMTTPGGKSVDNARSTPDQRHEREDMATLELMFIGEVLMSESAWNAGKFDQLIEGYGIRYEKELVASQALIEGLIESKVIAGGDADPDKKQDAALVFIDCPAVAMSKLLVALENDGQDFLGFNYNIAMSGASLGLPGDYDKLISALQSQTTSSNGRGTARLIVPDRSSKELSKLLPRFEAVEKKRDDKIAELVSADAQLKGSLPGVNESGKLLLIIRKN